MNKYWYVDGKKYIKIAQCHYASPKGKLKSARLTACYKNGSPTSANTKSVLARMQRTELLEMAPQELNLQESQNQQLHSWTSVYLREMKMLVHNIECTRVHSSFIFNTLKLETTQRCFHG